jgi:hypothetical protein
MKREKLEHTLKYFYQFVRFSTHRQILKNLLLEITSFAVARNVLYLITLFYYFVELMIKY